LVKKGEQVEGAEEPSVEEPTAPEPEAEVTEPIKTFTQEDVDAIVAEKDKAYQGLQKVIARKDREAEQRQKIPAQPKSSQVNVLKAMADTLATGEGEYGEVPEARKAKLAQLRQTIASLEQQERIEQMRIVAETEKQRMHQEAVDAGLDPYSEEFFPVEDAFDLGNYPAAKRRHERILAKHQKEAKPVEEKKVKTEEDKEAEIEARILEKYGLTKQDTGGPSAASGSKADKLRAIAEGEGSIDDLPELFKK